MKSIDGLDASRIVGGLDMPRIGNIPDDTDSRKYGEWDEDLNQREGIKILHAGPDSEQARCKMTATFYFLSSVHIWKDRNKGSRAS